MSKASQMLEYTASKNRGLRKTEKEENTVLTLRGWNT